MAVNSDNIPVKKKRIRYKIPCYKKVYSVYQYNQSKYFKIYKKIQELALKYDNQIFYKTEPYKVLNLCYTRNKKGCKNHLGDEKHIFRYKIFENILKEIANYLILTYKLLPRKDVLLYLFKRTHIALYNENGDMQAELMDYWRMSFFTRIKANLMLLRQLKKGLEIEDAVRITRKKYYIPNSNEL